MKQYPSIPTKPAGDCTAFWVFDKLKTMFLVPGKLYRPKPIGDVYQIDLMWMANGWVEWWYHSPQNKFILDWIANKEKTGFEVGMFLHDAGGKNIYMGQNRDFVIFLFENVIPISKHESLQWENLLERLDG